jgi:transcriptional regulator with XRE-family HTH domain
VSAIKRSACCGIGRKKKLIGELAAKGLELHVTTLSKIEKGIRPITLKDIYAFAAAFEISFPLDTRR